jgi:hypothetical protein
VQAPWSSDQAVSLLLACRRDAGLAPTSLSGDPSTSTVIPTRKWVAYFTSRT